MASVRASVAARNITRASTTAGPSQNLPDLITRKHPVAIEIEDRELLAQTLHLRFGPLHYFLT
jgi:hypothetical protein